MFIVSDVKVTHNFLKINFNYMYNFTLLIQLY